MILVPVPVPVLVLVLVLAQTVAGSAASAQVPDRAEVQDGLLRWPPAPQNTSLSVQVRRFEEGGWSDLPGCGRSSCNVSALIREAEHGCVRLRVRAPGAKAAEACSVSEGQCTPEVRLTSAPGALTVHLEQRHGLWEEFGRQAQYSVCHWIQDQLDQVCTETSSTLVLNLDPNRTYCVGVKLQVFSRLEGLPRCPLCLEVPQAPSRHMSLVLGTMIPGLVLGLGSAVAYVLIFHRKKLKTWLRPGPEPESLKLTLQVTPLCTTPEERYDHLTVVMPTDQD